MFNIYHREIPDAKYTSLAQKWEVKKWVDSDGRVRWYGCRHGHSHTNSGSCSFDTGLGVPPCDLENLADAIKFVMKECEDAGLFCELQEGTLLGNFSTTGLCVNWLMCNTFLSGSRFQLEKFCSVVFISIDAVPYHGMKLGTTLCSILNSTT